ncbi:MAG: dihydrolipoyl dehydrogenase [Alphaproteobacteria bacterium]|nr:dihydrolipoyl dehydrogenase [Alphaproteobacteria bacterium]
MANLSFDLAVVGSGPGGYVAAIRAAQLGLNAAVIERAELGGICLNWGCIPTKALLRSSDLLHQIRHAEAFGLQVSGVSFDLARIVKRSRAVAGQLSNGVKHLLRKHKVTVVAGSAKLAGPGRLAVTRADGGDTVSAKHIVLATGARARELPGLKADGKLVWTYREALAPDVMPKSLLVIGSGAIGIEFASFYRTLGAEVTVVEVLDRILPVEDAEISAFARKAFEKQGMKIHVGAQVARLEPVGEGVAATLEFAGGRSERQTFHRAILAVGIVGNVEGLGLEGTRVKVEKSHVVVDEWLRTGEPNVYAIGDLAGSPWLAHKAMHEGVICVERIAGLNDVHPLDTSRVPGCTYCWPQVASVGLTEAAAKAAGRAVRVGRFPFIGNGKAIAMGEPEGLIKTVFDAQTGELLGAHMIGAEVTELIQGFGIAKTLETTEADLLHTIFPHPTISEAMHEAVLDAYGRTLHI